MLQASGLLLYRPTGSAVAITRAKTVAQGGTVCKSPVLPHCEFVAQFRHGGPLLVFYFLLLKCLTGQVGGWGAGTGALLTSADKQHQHGPTLRCACQSSLRSGWPTKKKISLVEAERSEHSTKPSGERWHCTTASVHTPHAHTPRIMKLAVIGSRTFKDKALLEKTLASVKTPITLLISGGAIGADTMAQEWAKQRGIPTQIFKPDYEKYGGKKAPLERNLLIIAAAENVLAFHDGESRGTIHALRHAKKLNRPTHVVNFALSKSEAIKPTGLKGNLSGFARYTGPEPTSPEFDSRIHGLLAPPRTTVKIVK